MFVLSRFAASTATNSRPLTRMTTGQCVRNRTMTVTSRRWATTRETGAVLTEPQIIPLGLIKVFFTVLPGLYIGASISKTCAAFLEENDIFVPADDDDDD